MFIFVQILNSINCAVVNADLCYKVKQNKIPAPIKWQQSETLTNSNLNNQLNSPILDSNKSGWSLFGEKNYSFGLEQKNLEENIFPIKNFKILFHCEASITLNPIFHDANNLRKYSRNEILKLKHENPEEYASYYIKQYPIKINFHKKIDKLSNWYLLHFLFSFNDSKYIERANDQLNLYHTIPLALCEFEDAQRFRFEKYKEMIEIINKLPFTSLEDFLFFFFHLQFRSNYFDGILKYKQLKYGGVKNLLLCPEFRGNPFDLKSIEYTWNYWNTNVISRVNNLTIFEIYKVLMFLPELGFGQAFDFRKRYFRCFIEFYDQIRYYFIQEMAAQGNDDISQISS